ncbi:MAG TPA: threonine--tRNA ligase [Pyrinomonadaceae bacterium]
MSEINVKIGERERAIPAPATVADAIKAVDRDTLKKSLAAKLNGVEVDLNREITGNADVISIEPITADSRDGLEVIRHSAAHLLAAAVLDLYPGTKLGVGPALMDDPRYGFFYDLIAPVSLSEDDLPKIEKRMRELAKRNLPYRREDIEKAKLLDIFRERDEPLKCELIDEKVDRTASVYYIDNSPFIDFCLGPHVPHTGKLQAFKLLALSGAYWKGDANNQQMQRIYGIAFAKQEELDAWLKQREEAEKRDHRRLGRELDLFSISDEYGQGLVLWHPKGGIIRGEMERLLREELERRDYSFVYTPHIAKRELWRISGHEENYADSMYAPTRIEDEEYRLKPMNCPLHIGIYKSSPRSYRDLPQRYSEAGTVYRAELSGTLHGLMRVRGFTVDDAHLFVRPDQIQAEISDCLDLALKVFQTYGFEKVRFELSVRGDADNKFYLGSDETWQAAEEQLARALNERGISYERIEGEAAFYGPKIDIKIEDAIGRIWQLGTIQVDWNLPERFGLEYTGEDGQKHQPVMIHRALFGSIERFFGILIEHYAGAFPLWLAPVQIVVLPITDRINEYARSVAGQLREAGLRVDTNLKSDKIGAKIRDAQLQKIPYMVVLGDKELEEQKVAVRERKRGDIGQMSLAEFLEMVTEQKLLRAL